MVKNAPKKVQNQSNKITSYPKIQHVAPIQKFKSFPKVQNSIPQNNRNIPSNVPTTNTLTQKVGGVLQRQTDIAISQAKLTPAKSTSLPISPKKTKQKQQQQQQQQILTSQQKQNKNSNKPEKIPAKVLNLQRNSQQQQQQVQKYKVNTNNCLLYTSPSPRDQRGSRMPSSA